VRYIEDFAFEGCTSWTPPPSFVKENRNAFLFMDSIPLPTVAEGKLTIPPDITIIEEKAYENRTDIREVIVPESVTEISAAAFSGCTSLVTIIIPCSVATIGDDAFFNCVSLVSITIPDSVKTIGELAFCQCASLASISLPSGLTSIKDLAFARCSTLRHVSLPPSLVTIGVRSFERCSSLLVVIIPEGVTDIGLHAFCDCASMGYLKIPQSLSVTNVGLGGAIRDFPCEVFEGCVSLGVVSVPKNIFSYSNITEANRDDFPLEFCFDRCDKLDALSETCHGHDDPSITDPVLWYLKSLECAERVREHEARISTRVTVLLCLSRIDQGLSPDPKLKVTMSTPTLDASLAHCLCDDLWRIILSFV